MTPTVYLLFASTGLFLVYLVFLGLIRNSGFPAFNRLFLISTTLLAIFMPFNSIRIAGDIEAYTYVSLSEITVYANSPKSASSEIPLIMEVLTICYFAGFIFRALILLFKTKSLLHLFKKSKSITIDGTPVCIIHGEIAPFSFAGKICLPEYLLARPELHSILLHEKSHIRRHHSLDIFLMEIIAVVFWFLPFIYHLKKVLKEQHEFQADQDVINMGINTYDYSEMLITFSMAFKHSEITSTFNYSFIKRRLLMITKKKRPLVLLSRFSAALPIVLLICIALSCANHTEKKEEVTNENKAVVVVTDTASVVLTNETGNNTVSSNAVIVVDEEEAFTVVEEMPKFPGGEAKLMKYLAGELKYPEEAKEKGIQGTVFVQFTVSSTGEVKKVKVLKGVNDLLDNEALRVCKSMPDWIPGKQKGKEVATIYSLPVRFKLN